MEFQLLVHMGQQQLRVMVFGHQNPQGPPEIILSSSWTPGLYSSAGVLGAFRNSNQAEKPFTFIENILTLWKDSNINPG